MTILESPLDVLDRCLFQMTLDMMCSVLGDVSNTQGGMFVDNTLLRFNLSCQDFDQSGFSCSIGSDDPNTTEQR